MSEMSEIQAQIHSLPPDRKEKFWVSIALIMRCFLKDDSAVLIHLNREGKPELTTTGINATYEDSFHMVQASYGMFMDTLKDMENAKENLQ